MMVSSYTMAQSGGAEKKDAPAGAGGGAETEFRALRDEYVKKYEPLFVASSQAWWDANTTGSDEAFARRKENEAKLVELHSDAAVFAKLKAFKDGGQIKDPVLSRELDVMYRAYLPGQADTELQKRIISLESDVEQIFNTHRGLVGDKELSENDIRQVLSDTKESKSAESAWKAYMAVGAKVDGKLRELVSLRNQLAKKLGYRDFYAFRLAAQEIDEKELYRLLDELDELTSAPFAEAKKQIDANMAKRFRITEQDLRPWHYNDLFFQESPGIEPVNLDDVYKSVDLLRITKVYYKSMGLETEDILSRSDLYEKPKKSPHAFSTSIDRRNNIRILTNLKPNAYWADTLVHELGHAVYDKYIWPQVPFLLREPSHSLTTEGYAIMMGAMVKNEEFLTHVTKTPKSDLAKLVDSARKSLRAEKLLFARWSQVMARFEQGMYGNPEQDLGKLWWDLKKKYQLLNPPDDVSKPDYAAKIHIVSAPVYYHSYMMGDLFACQVHQHIARKVLKIDDPNKTCFWGKKEAGEYMREKIFGPGNLYSWNELTRRATDEPLTAKYFVELYVKQ